MRLFVGIDVSKDDFKAVVKDDRNNLVMPAKTYYHDKPGLELFDKDIKALREQFRCNASFGMEATGIYHLSLSEHLVNAKEHVKVFNGLELKRFKGRIRKTKTDKIDAEIIAEALYLEMEPSYHPIEQPELLRIRELCRLRQRIISKIKLCKQQAIRDMEILCRGYDQLFTDIFSPSSVAVMKAVFRKTRMFEISYDELTDLLRPLMKLTGPEKKARQLLEVFENAVVPEHIKDVSILELHMLIKQHDILKAQIGRVERKIKKRVLETNTHILTIPAIGPLTAAVILGELGDLTRFTSLNQLTAFAGLDPSVKESGRSRHTGHISKRGSPILREALYNAALSATQVNPVCKQFYLRLKNKGKHHKVCRIALARKLLHIAYSVEKNQRDFYVPAYITEQEP